MHKNVIVEGGIYYKLFLVFLLLIDNSSSSSTTLTNATKDSESEPMPIAEPRIGLRFAPRPHPAELHNNLRRPPRHPSLPWNKNRMPPLHPHSRRPGPNGPDLEAHAQTLYDLRGFHIPLGHDETQRYLRSQNSQQQQQPQTLVFPSFFQPQPNVHDNRPQVQVTPLSIFGHNQHHQEKLGTTGNNYELSSSGVAGTGTDFRPSQPDLGDKATTENVFKPFVPKQFSKEEKEQHQQNGGGEEIIPNQVEQQNPFIYVYDYDDAVEDEQNLRNQNHKNSNIKIKEAKTTAISLLPAKNIEPTQQFLDNQYYTDNFIPFNTNEELDDRNRNHGNYYTKQQVPNVEIVPSSERRPPPDQRNSIRDTQLLKNNFEQQPQQVIEIEPTYQTHQKSHRNNNQQILTTVESFPEQNHQQQHNPYPTVAAELYTKPTNPTFHNNINPTPYFQQQQPKIHQQQQQHFRPQHHQNQPQYIINEPNEINQQDPFELSFVQKYNPYTNSQEKVRQVNTIFVPHQNQNQNHQQIQFEEPEEHDQYENHQEIEVPVRTTSTSTTTTTTTTTTPQPPTTTRGSLFRNRFPPFRGGNGNGLLGLRSGSTTTTEEPVTTLQPRRINRPRLRPSTTTTTTTTTTPEPVYYDEEQLNDNSVEVLPTERPVSRIRQRKLNGNNSRRSKETQSLEVIEEEVQTPRRAGGGRTRGTPPQQSQESTNQSDREVNNSRNGKIRNFNRQNNNQQQTQQQQNNFVVENPPQPQQQSHNLGGFNRGVISHHGFQQQQQPEHHQQHQQQQQFGLNPTLSTAFQAPGYLPTNEPSYEQPITFRRPGNFGFQSQREFDNGPFHNPHPGLLPQRNGFNPNFFQPQNHRFQFPGPYKTGKPLYVHSGKIRQGGLYANVQGLLPEYHNYGTPVQIAQLEREPPRIPEPIVQNIRPNRGRKPGAGPTGRQRVREDIRVITPTVQVVREEPIRTVQSDSREVQRDSPPPRALRPRQRERTTPAPIVVEYQQPSTLPPRRKQLKRIRVTPDSIIHVTTPEPSSSSTIGVTEPIVVYYNREVTSVQPSTPSLQFTLPSTAKPNPLRRKPKIRPFKVADVLGVSPTSSPATTTSRETTTYIDANGESISSPRPVRKLLRPGRLVKKPRKLTVTEAPPLEPISLSSAKVFRKPTEAPNRFSSKYRDETLTIPPPTAPVVPEYVSVTQANIISKPKKNNKLKFIPTSPRPKPKEDPEDKPSEIPSNVFLSPKDVIQNRKPARRIPPGSASERLKVLQERRKNVLNKPKKFVFSTSTTTQAPAIDEHDGGDEDYEDEYASSSEQIKREIQHRPINSKNSFLSTNLAQSKSKSSNNNHSLEHDSQETSSIVGVPKPTEDPINTAESLAWIPVLNASKILASSTRRTSGSGSSKENTPTTTESNEIKSKPALIDSIPNFDSQSAESSLSSSPFNLFSMSNSSPTLPLEAIFPILSKESQTKQNSSNSNSST